MGHQEVYRSGELRRRFDVPGATFESVLADVVGERREADTDRLNIAIADVFAAMNEAFLQTAVDRERDHSHVGSFLQYMNGSGGCNIVSLNQDLWFELWSALGGRPVHVVGVGERMPPVVHTWSIGASQEQRDRIQKQVRPVQRECKLKPNTLNLVKVHGSCDWYINGKPQIAVGGDKETTIGNAPILNKLQSLGNRAITAASHLLIVGYSFRDAHINRALASAAQNESVEIAVVDVVPFGSWYRQVNDFNRPFRDSGNVRLITGKVRHYISAGMSAFGFWNSSLDPRLRSFADGEF